MAEAHSAVAFTFTVTPDGDVDVNLNWVLLDGLWHSLVNSLHHRVVKFRNAVHNGVYPLKPFQWLVFLGILLGFSLIGIDLSYGCVEYIEEHWPVRHLSGVTQHVVATIIFATAFWISVSLLIRQLFKWLLSYRGWMNNDFGKMSLFDKIYLKTMQFLSHQSPLLFSLQGSLPNLPLPKLDDTLKRYITSVRPLLNDEEFEQMKKLSEEFRNGVGPKLQRYVWLKWLTSTNYVSDWWEKYVYLKGRGPIMVNSNFYGTALLGVIPTPFQAARAANLTYFAFKYRTMLDREQMKPVYAGNCIPLCSWQYERNFNTTRIPGEQIDAVVHFESSRHIVVFHRGRYFKVVVYSGNRLLQANELEKIFQMIIDDPSKPAEGEMHLGALTAGSRTPWAIARKQYFFEGINRQSLRDIEQAAFFVALDDEEYGYDPNDYTKYDRTIHAYMHGKCYDRWYDKSFQFIVGSNGEAGINTEHTWADAPIVVQMWEYISANDCVIVKYGKDGHCLGDGSPSNVIRPPIRLHWNIVPTLQHVINDSLKEAEALAQNVDLHLTPFFDFGKGFIKKCKLSPDAFLQMALQLASYRDQGRFWLTYEASMTRLYKEGRTETVRSCSVQSCDWVRSMDDPSKTNEQRIELLRTACKNHQELYKAAMNGAGIDRHLFTLYVVSRWLEVDSEFLKKVLSEPWRLSTSQTPIWTTDIIDLKKLPWVISCGGGFGPVADDGYGISYVINGETVITFHVSSMKSCPTTDSLRMSENIIRAMKDMKALFEP